MTVKVRFAPSPTGKLHVGNMRTAIVNWLFARQCDGDFILRLDDTDTARSTEEFADGIKEDLTWLGLDWDSIFRQSDRFELYDKAAQKLKEGGRLYPCYETAQELDLKRKIQLGQGRPPVYDRAGLNLTAEDVAKYVAEGRRPHWRFKLLTPARIKWTDLVKGEISFDMESLSDPILIREDGSYLYTLPSVVDDIDYEITHIMRGEDHTTNSAVQVQLFEALGVKSPELCHFSLLTGIKGEGLSKRLGSASIHSYRKEEGLEAMSLMCLLARLGSSLPILPFTDVKELIKTFDFKTFSRSAAKFDPYELEVINAKILHQTEFEDIKSRIDITEDFWNIARANIKKLKDTKELISIINGPITPKIEDADFAAKALELLPIGDWDNGTWKLWTAAVKDAAGVKGKALFMPLRQALTGADHGPEMGTLLPFIGREKASARLKGEIV